MKNDLTFGVLDSICLKQAGNLSQNRIKSSVRQTYVNVKMNKIYRMLDGLNDPFYNWPYTLSIAADHELLKDTTVNGGVITAIDTTGKTIERSGGGVFIAGSILHITVINEASGAILGCWMARIVTGGATATYVKIGAGTEYTLGTHPCSVIVQKSLSTTTFDVSGLYFKEIVRISDWNFTITPGEKIRIYDKETDSERFYGYAHDPTMVKRVAWYHRGDTIEFFVGASAIALGAPEMEYKGKPTLYTDATIDNEVQIPVEDNSMLIDEVVASFLIETGQSIPADIAGRQAQYEKMYAAAEANRAKALQMRDSK